MTQQEALKEIEKHVKVANDALAEAAKIADEHNLTFYFGPTYGMSGRYDGEDEGRWIPSSEEC